jgi:hypothetical protein
MPKQILDYEPRRNHDGLHRRWLPKNFTVAILLMLLVCGCVVAWVGVLTYQGELTTHSVPRHNAGLGILQVAGLLYVCGWVVGCTCSRRTSTATVGSAATILTSLNLWFAVFLNGPLLFYWIRQIMGL